MLKPRKAKIPFFSVILIAALFTPILPGEIRAQQQSAASDERGRGVNLYNQGNDKEAIAALRLAVKQSDDDLSAWHYLGLALARQGKRGDARKAYEKAAKLGEKILEKLFDAGPYENFGDRVKPFKPLLEEAADSAEKYLALISKSSRLKEQEWSERAATLRDYLQLYAREGDDDSVRDIYKASEVTTRARILSRPEPMYTEEARKDRVSGVIVLRGIFASDGKVRAIRVVRGLPDGLTKRCIDAARRIKFIPATKDGRPVSQYIQMEYNFDLY